MQQLTDLREILRYVPHFRDKVFVKPDLLGRRAFLKEQEVGTDAGVGLEHAIGESDDSVKIALLH